MSSLDLFSPRSYQYQHNSTYNSIFWVKASDIGRHLKVLQAHPTGSFERQLVLSYVDPVTSAAILAFGFY